MFYTDDNKSGSFGDLTSIMRGFRVSVSTDSESDDEKSETPISTSLSYHDYKNRAETNLKSSLQQSLKEPQNLRETQIKTEQLQPSFKRLIITSTGKEINPENVEVSKLILDSLHFRKKYLDTLGISLHPCLLDPLELPPKSEHIVDCKDGIFYVYQNGQARFMNRMMCPVISLNTFYKDLNTFMGIISQPVLKTYSYKRLQLLESKFRMHVLLNEEEELTACKSVPHRDFYNVRKVDTHVHHSSSMNQKHLLSFIKRKWRECPNETVIFRDGKYLTLAEVFESLNLTIYDLSVDTLDVHADKNTFHRFDKFNLKYNPCGQSRLREVFMKQDNFIKGRFLAELTKELFNNLKESKYQYAEYRISIYGRNINEFSNLAAWICDNNLFSDHVRWLIQVPRLYEDFKVNKMIENFGQVIRNIFEPLFQVTLDPSSDPKLHKFLQSVVGFDCVDDESKAEKRYMTKYTTPDEWNRVDNPPYSYYLFYLYGNLKTLNHFRQSKGMNTFQLRPHSGEAGEIDHLASAYLLAHGISHGINLRKAPSLQYLYYLSQIPMSMSPLSNNSLFLDYDKNPFPIFFSRGLNVTLSTDDPLQFHYTKEPLIEEYSIAAQVWKFSPCDLCEIALNSVLSSGFDAATKASWLGKNYQLKGPLGNDIAKTNVPNIRICFRYETLCEDFLFLQKCLMTLPNYTVLDCSPLMELLPAYIEYVKNQRANEALETISPFIQRPNPLTESK